MTSTQLAVVKRPEMEMPRINAEVIEQALTIGDLSQMPPELRVRYYIGACQSMGLNPYTKPLDAIKTDNGEVILYPNKGAAEQLRRIYRVSLSTVNREQLNGLYIVTVKARTPDGREEEAIGAVPIEAPVGQWKTSQNGKRFFEEAKDKDGQPVYSPLRGKDLANALKKAETQAKRRATLGICGLGFAASDDVQGEPVDFTITNPEIDAMHERESRKSLAEHTADLFPVKEQHPDEGTIDDEDDIPDSTNTPDLTAEEKAWRIEARVTLAALRDLRIAGKLNGDEKKLFDALQSIADKPNRSTQGQRTILLRKAQHAAKQYAGDADPLPFTDDAPDLMAEEETQANAQ